MKLKDCEIKDVRIFESKKHKMRFVISKRLLEQYPEILKDEDLKEVWV